MTSGARCVSASSAASRLSPLVADVHGGRRRVRPDEEPPLGLEVLLQRAVQVEVILGQVREDERVETNPTEPPEGRAVRGRFDRGAPVPRVEHLPKETLELDRLGCGERRATLLAADDPADGPDQSGPAIRGRRASSAGGRSSSSCRSSPSRRRRRAPSSAPRRTRQRRQPSRRVRPRRRAEERRPRAAARPRERPRPVRSPPTRDRDRRPVLPGHRRRAQPCDTVRVS